MNPRLALVLFCMASVGAQQPGAHSLPPSTPFRDVFVADATEDGTVWVRGERYKLALATDGVSFQPLFGPRAPRDYPVRFQLLGCEVAGAPLPLVAGDGWQRHGQRFEQNRGPLRECWNVMTAAAQQFFVVERPPQAGSLTLRIGCSSDLIGVDDGPGVRFVANGLGDVRYSDAVVFDAAGRRLDVPVELVGETLTITVPASFTVAAAWPLVVDPLVTTVAVDSTISDMQDSRVACDPTSGNWLVVAEEHLSATDVDIVCKRYDSAAVPALLDTTYADATADLTHNPDVGIVASMGRFIIAWHNASGLGSFGYRNRTAISTAQGATFITSTGIGGDLSNRCAVGSSLTIDRWLLVMFRRNVTGNDIFARLTSSSGTGFATLFVGPVTPSHPVGAGDVSTLQDLTDSWVIIWRECTNIACGSMKVRMQALGLSTSTGPFLTQPTVDLATSTFEDEPAIAGHAGNLLAAWRTFDGVTNSNDIHGVPIGVTAGTFGPLGAVQNLSAQEPNVNNLLEQTSPTVSYDGCRFVYGYLEDTGNDTLLPHAATVFVAGSSIAWHEGHLQLSSVHARSLDLGYGANSNAGVHWATWQQDSALFTGDLRAAVIDARTPGITSTIDQTGCGLPTEPGISLAGSPALGRTFTVTMTAPVGFPIMLVGPQSISILPACNSCWVGVDIFQMQAFAQSSLTVTVPCDPSLIQFRLAFQGLTMLQTGGCPASFVGFDFALSDTLTIQVL